MNNNQENKHMQEQEQETNKSAKSSFFAKRWTFPVIYLAASVLIVGLMYAKSNNAAQYDVKKTETPKVSGPQLPATDSPVTPANSTPTFVWPVGEGGDDAAISMDFYREDASDEEKAAALISYENSFIPNLGVNLGLKTDASFSVVAAAKGTVLSVTEDPLMGQTVEIQHEGGYTTYYASLTNVDVQKGAQVLAGQPIAKTGNNRLEKDEKNHLHFEVRKDGKQVDPSSLLSKKPKMNAAQPTTSTGDTAGKGSSTGAPPAEKQDAGMDAAGAPTNGSNKTE